MKLSDFIVKTTLQNSNLNGEMSDKKFETKDKIFLLSKMQYVTFTNLENPSFPLSPKATDYAILSDVKYFNGENFSGFPFYLRTTCNTKQDLVDQYFVSNFSEKYTSDCFQGVRPALYLDANTISSIRNSCSNSKFFKIEEQKQGKIKYHTITFGEFPKSVVSDKKLIKNIKENGKETGQKFYCNYDLGGWLNSRKVIEYNGEKYVQMISDRGYIKLSNKKTAKRGNDYYVKVEPITWCIANWDNLPKTINPLGNGTQSKMLLISEDVLFSMPFYSVDILSGVSTTPKNANLWQNSTIRGYLNGISVNHIKTNGNPLYSTPGGGDFSNGDDGFLSQAFSANLTNINIFNNSNNKSNDKSNENSSKTSINKNNNNTNEINNFGVKNMNKNVYNFNFNDLSNDDLLNLYIQSNTAVFLHGTSGVGKSSRVKQIDPDATRITLRPQMNPEEIDGTLNRETGEFIPPLWYTQLVKKCKAEPNKKHVLFIDELTNVKPTVQSLVYSIVLDRAGKDGLWPLPENAVVVAAGNENADNLAAYPLTNALFRRFCHIYFEVNKEQWLDWAMGIRNKVEELKPTEKQNRAKIHPAIVAYLMSRDENVLNQDLDEENPEIVTDPRKWEIASNVLYATNNPKALIPALGEDITADFVDFVTKCNISVNDVMENSFNPNSFKNLDIASKLSNIMSLTTAKEEELPKVRSFISKYFGKEILTTFDSMWIRNDPERAQIIYECENGEIYTKTPNKTNTNNSTNNSTNSNSKTETKTDTKTATNSNTNTNSNNNNNTNKTKQVKSLLDKIGSILSK